MLKNVAIQDGVQNKKGLGLGVEVAHPSAMFVVEVIHSAAMFVYIWLLINLNINQGRKNIN